MAELDISTKNCIVEQEGNVLIVTLNRPEAKNAFSPEMLLGMYKAWRLLEEDEELYCAILTANGDTFCAGMDLKAFVSGETPMVEGRGFAGLTEKGPRKPLIAAVEGYALAGGLELAIWCDLRVAADEGAVAVGHPLRHPPVDHGNEVVVLCELQRFDAEIRYRIAQEGRGRRLLMTADPAKFGDAVQHVIRAASVGMLAMDRFENRTADSVEVLAPEYIRKSDAQIHRASC